MASVEMKRFFAAGVAVCGLAVWMIAAGCRTTEGQMRTRHFAKGVHYLDETLVLTAADSGMVLTGEPGAVLSGGKVLAGWRKEPDGMWSAAVPWVTDRQHGFRHLTVNGQRRERAVHPNEGYFTSLDKRKPGSCLNNEWNYHCDTPYFAIHADEIDPKWKLGIGELNFYHLWVDSHCVPDQVETDTNGVTWVHLAVPVNRNPYNQLWRLENLREIADRSGEWALDYDEKRVYYRPLPDEDMAKVEVVAPHLEQLVRVDGAKNVRFEGLCFADARFELDAGDRNDTQAAFTVRAAVVLTNAEDCVFSDCTFERLGGYAVKMDAGTRNCRILRSSFCELGAGGVHLDGGYGWLHTVAMKDGEWDNELPDPHTRVMGNEIADCDIGPYGLDFKDAIGVLIRHAEGTKVHHNEIHDGYYSGVSVGWNWGYLYSVARDNEICHNHIHDIGKGLLSDMGGIYTLGVSPGTKMCHNLIHDIDARYYGGWGLYNDEGSSGILIEDNIVYNTKFSAYHLHFGRDNTVRNNILAGGRREQLTRSRREPHTSFAFYNNIIYWTEGPLHTGDWNDAEAYDFTYFPGRSRKLKKTTLCDYNVYFNPGKSRDEVKFGTAKAGVWADWQKAGQDRHSVYADPLFKDVATHDYTLLPDSPALKLGFRPIDTDDIGPRKR